MIGPDKIEKAGGTRLVEAQVLFVWITAGVLVMGGVRAWMRSGMLAGDLFLVISAVLFTAWRLAPPYAGVFILAAGMVTSFLQCRWQNIAVLSWSLAITGLGDALFNIPPGRAAEQLCNAQRSSRSWARTAPSIMRMP
jgi:hypothetical protein